MPRVAVVVGAAEATLRFHTVDALEKGGVEGWRA